MTLGHLDMSKQIYIDVKCTETFTTNGLMLGKGCFFC